jgi:hypothetical protein
MSVCHNPHLKLAPLENMKLALPKLGAVTRLWMFRRPSADLQPHQEPDDWFHTQEDSMQRNHSKVSWLFSILAGTMLCFTVSCTHSDSSARSIEYSHATDYIAADTIVCQRIGGGQIDFTIQRSESPTLAAQMTFHVSKLHYADTDSTFTLVQADFDAQTWQQLEGLFAGTVNIGGVVYQDEAATGTWFYAYVKVGDTSTRIADSTTLQILSALQKAVESHIQTT